MQENKLADGREFNFWEKEVNYVRTLYVACDAVNASDAMTEALMHRLSLFRQQQI